MTRCADSHANFLNGKYIGLCLVENFEAISSWYGDISGSKSEIGFVAKCFPNLRPDSHCLVSKTRIYLKKIIELCFLFGKEMNDFFRDSTMAEKKTQLSVDFQRIFKGVSDSDIHDFFAMTGRFLSDETFTTNCISCKVPDEEEVQRTFYEDANCRAVLRTDNQCWLGRYILVPKIHMDPVLFWESELSSKIMQVHAKIACVIMTVFGATTVQMAQLGSLTVNEHNEPTCDQRYQHSHIHGIPRYAVPPVFQGKLWPDPQFIQGKFTALNIDPKCGLAIVKPTQSEIVAIVAALKGKFECDPVCTRCEKQRANSNKMCDVCHIISTHCSACWRYCPYSARNPCYSCQKRIGKSKHCSYMAESNLDEYHCREMATYPFDKPSVCFTHFVKNTNFANEPPHCVCFKCGQLSNDTKPKSDNVDLRHCGRCSH